MQGHARLEFTLFQSADSPEGLAGGAQLPVDAGCVAANLWMEVPRESTATVTGKSASSNSWIASMPRSSNASTRARRMAFDRSYAAPPTATRYAAPWRRMD